jgi:hypothetical protein
LPETAISHRGQNLADDKFGLPAQFARSPHRDRPYRGSRSKDWVKVKNRNHPAIERVKDAFS